MSGIPVSTIEGGWAIYYDGLVVSRRDIPMKTEIAELVEKVDELIGDGNSQVKVGGSAKFKHGRWELMCWSTVGITCNQDAQSIYNSQQVAGATAFAFLSELRERLEEDAENILGGQHGT